MKARVILALSWGYMVKAYSSKEVIKILKKDGWEYAYATGSHCQFRHPDKPGKVTVPHPKNYIPIGTVKSILEQAGIEL